MPSTHYTDSDEFGAQPSGGSRGGGAPASYTDRFRTYSSYDQPRGLHGPGANSIPRMLQLIEQACRITLREPDLATNLQITDIINDKKGNAPREAAQAIVKILNTGPPPRSILAIALLDCCVKNCGYPFHLQISRKEFLNKLVLRFPEKPPLHYNRIQLLVLQCIEEWSETLCKTTKYRDDLGYIRDMHRLLSNKGYLFPEVNIDDAAVLTANEDALKTASQLEEEDRQIQEVKLQELIRSGRPEDIREANQLMSIMAGFKDTKVDYRAKVAKELDRLRRKAEILEEMIANAVPGEKLANDDVFSEIVTSLRSSIPKLDSIIKEEAEDDTNAKDKVEALKGYIESLITKYDLLVKGDFEAAASVEMTSLSSGRKIDTSRQAVLNSLIDIDDVDGTPGASTSSGDDLLGLSFGGLSGLNLGGLNLGTPASASPAPKSSDNDLLNFDGASASTAVAANTTSSSRSKTANSELLGDLWGSSPAPQPASASPAAGNNIVIFDDDTLKINLEVTRSGNDTLVVARFSNPSDKKITNLRFEAAQPKSFTLQIDPQSSTELAPRQTSGITQKLKLSGSGKPRFRWRIAYNWGIESRNATGGSPELDSVA